MSVHDEAVYDSFYTSECSEISTCIACFDKNCICRGSGSCKFMIFNHYLYRVGATSPSDEPPTIELDQFDFPLSVNESTGEEITIEEIRCRRYTVGAAYNYYVSGVVQNPSAETMISLALGDYKSTCFNMPCFVLEVHRSAVEPGSLCLDGGTGRYASVLAGNRATTAPLLEAMCILGMNPIVSPTGNYSIEVAHGGGTSFKMDAHTSGFRWFKNGPLNVMGELGSEGSHETTGTGSDIVRAVRTARVTISVVLTPKSLYGGKNPTTKLVSYFVHNVDLR